MTEGDQSRAGVLVDGLKSLLGGKGPLRKLHMGPSHAGKIRETNSSSKGVKKTGEFTGFAAYHRRKFKGGSIRFLWRHEVGRIFEKKKKGRINDKCSRKKKKASRHLRSVIIEETRRTGISLQTDYKQEGEEERKKVKMGAMEVGASLGVLFS